MGFLWFIWKKLALISTLFLACASWHAEVQAQSASLLLSWTDTSNNEDGFKIERLIAGLVDATLTIPANASSYVDSALVAGTVYCYRVEAFNSAGGSDPSNQACATAQGSTASLTRQVQQPSSREVTPLLAGAALQRRRQPTGSVFTHRAPPTQSSLTGST